MGMGIGFESWHDQTLKLITILVPLNLTKKKSRKTHGQDKRDTLYYYALY